jgi:hypothetical protein
MLTNMGQQLVTKFFMLTNMGQQSLYVLVVVPYCCNNLIGVVAIEIFMMF